MSNNNIYISLKLTKGIGFDYHSDISVVNIKYRANISSSNKISHNTELYRIWYNLYKIDKILLTDNAYNKTINIFEKSFDDNNNYLEYINYNISNTLIGQYNTTINNYSDFLYYISIECNKCTTEYITLHLNYNYISNLKKHESIKIIIHNFNKSLCNTTLINNINNMNNNTNTIQENVIFFKYNIKQQQLAGIDTFKYNISKQDFQSYIDTFKNNISKQQNLYLSLRQTNTLIKDCIYSFNGCNIHTQYKDDKIFKKSLNIKIYIQTL